MLKISFSTAPPTYKHLVLIKPSTGGFTHMYTELNPLCDALDVQSSAVFVNVCGAQSVTVVVHKEGISYRELGSIIYQMVKTLESVHIDTTLLKSEAVVDVAVGIQLKSYAFDRHKTITKESDSLKQVIFVTNQVDVTQDIYVRHAAIVDGIFAARDVANEPANVLTPIAYANRAKGLEKLGVTVKVLEPDVLHEMGMGALLGVAQGSVNPARVVVMEYAGGYVGDAPFAFVGKGVTFDTGGISIKPSVGMEDMKFDMGGSAAVYGAMHTVAIRKAKANVVGVIGLVENMVDGNAQRPGDIVTSMSGQTIEVLNTDAEGRLVLADCLTYVQRTYKPRSIINLATLTGAVMVALGTDYAGLFSNNDNFANQVLRASAQVGERLWHMPVGDVFDKMIDSPFADMKNISNGRWGGASVAAAFLARFVDDCTPWVHLDIAGTASTNKGNAFAPTGGTGFGVATLDQVIYDFETAQ